MAVISVTIVESLDQVVAGIPRSIVLGVNIPATIFYTLDNTDPTLFSTIYTSPIQLPTTTSVILKIFATNGIDNSIIITEYYVTNIISGNDRLAHAATTAIPSNSNSNLYPFGTNPNQPVAEYLNPALSGITVNDPNLSQIPNGFNSDGYYTGFTNQPFNLQNYDIIYSTTDNEGRTGKGIGNLPGNIKFTKQVPVPEQSSINSKLFDPRALVIYQDVSKENLLDPPHINRQFFSLEDPEKVRDGNNFFTAGIDSPPISGGLVNQFFNPRDNSMTSYYYDNISGRWLISKAPYLPSEKPTSMGNMYSVCSKGIGKVFEWIPFSRRVLI